VRVVFLTHYYVPEQGAPQTRISALARGLAKRGVEVTVHTCFPHYPSGRIARPYRLRPLSTETLDGVRVVRVGGWVAPNRGVAPRVADHASHALAMLASAPAAGAADVVVAETPPLFTAGAAIAYARAKRAALVVNVADRWPESAVQLGALTSARSIAAAERLERAIYRAADRITVPTSGLADDLDALTEARGKVTPMPPAVDLERFDVANHFANGTLRLLYAGTIGMAHGLTTLVDAAELAGPDAVQVTVAGDGAEAGSVAARAASVPNVRMLGPVPSERIPTLYSEADAAAVLLRDAPLFESALPTKILEALAAARPVVLAARGEAAALVESAGAGLVVPPEDPHAMAAAIERLANDRSLAKRFGEAGRRLAEERFGREQQVDRWLDLLRAVSERPGASL
jgi:glycosyltransferase involved in cell wall biosynthesis